MSDTIESPRLAEERLAPYSGAVEPATAASPQQRVNGLVGTACLVVVGAGFVLYAVRAGMPAGNAMRALIAVAATQVLPGALVWRVVRPRHGWWLEDLAMGFAIGSTIAVGVQILAGLTRQTWLSTALPLGIAIALLASARTRSRIVTRQTSPLPWWWGLIVAGAALIALEQLHQYFRLVPLSWVSGARTPHVDAPLHLALASQLATRGPTRFPWVESEALGYHWFSHSWVAQVSKVSGAGLDEVLFRFMPVLMPLAVVVSVAMAAVRLSGRPWTGPVAAILTMAGGDLNVFGKLTPGFPIAPLSPSLALAAPALVAIVVVLALRWRRQLLSGGVVLLPVLCVGAAGTKGSTVPLIVAGLALAIVAMLVVDRSRVRELLADFAIVGISLVFAVVAVFRGSSAGLQPDLAGAAAQTPFAIWLGGVRSSAAQAFVISVTVAGIFSRALGTVALLFSSERRRDPLTWLLLGASAAAAVAVGIFTHPGSSQLYFARSAAPLMALGSTLGLVLMIDKLGASARSAIPLGVVAGPVLALAPVALLGPLLPGGTRHAAVMVIVAVVLLAIVAALAALSGSNHGLFIGSVLVVAILAASATVVANSLIQYAAPPEPETVAVTRPLAVSRDQIDAARWIRDNSEIDDVVMTNRHCISPTRPVNCDNRRFVVAAYSERQVLVEGWTPAPKAQEIAPEGRDSITVNYWKPGLLRLNDRFIAKPTAEAARELRELGVRWIFVDHTRPYAETLEPYADLRFSVPGVDVYEFPPAGG